ncbi:hypothetical protein P8452_38523 [Trifolium repens]|nr:hypothetical protein P8452_38523 [Trifolium repens]
MPKASPSSLSGLVEGLKPQASYGRGRDASDERFSSLLFGTNPTVVVIIGYNGPIDGHGSYPWNNLHKDELKLIRSYLIELMSFNHIQLSILTLINLPSRIQDCETISGDDCVAIKSDWHEYGIKLEVTSQHIIIRRLKYVSHESARIPLSTNIKLV